MPHSEPHSGPHLGPQFRPRVDRYTRTAIALHWLIAVDVIVQFCWGWWMQGVPKQPAGMRADAFNLHKSVGMTILMLMSVRLLWRWGHPPPAFPAMPKWQAALAHVVHATLYAVLLLHPLSGYLGSVFSGYPVRFFGVLLPTWAAKNEAWKDLLANAHLTNSCILAAAIAIHVLAALKHHFIDGNGLLRRRWVRRAA